MDGPIRIEFTTVSVGEPRRKAARVSLRYASLQLFENSSSDRPSSSAFSNSGLRLSKALLHESQLVQV